MSELNQNIPPRILIVSNRLPVQITMVKGKLDVKQSIGGLATGMHPVHETYETLWIGWSGFSRSHFAPGKLKTINNAYRAQDCLPVYLDESMATDYYDGFSNGTIWPLFHYFAQYTEYQPDYWDAYLKVNRIFAEKIKKEYRPGDLIWIHDYHLLVLPQMVRELIPEADIGFFLHIPFPSFEVFRLLPWRKELVEGLVGSDLIGFHTFDYTRHFLSTVRRLLGYDIDLNRIQTGSRLVRTEVFPMGIDYRKYQNASLRLEKISEKKKSKLKQQISQYFSQAPERKLILSIDRLDYTKGIPNRLVAFEKFLEKYPEFQGKVTMLMIATPTRDNVAYYQQIKRTVDELVGRINGQFSQINWTPIWYFYRSFTFNQLIELYRSCHVALITPVRDGMNLVAKEYLASRIDQSGVLILSEMAGAARELSEALIINPNHPEEIAGAIAQALTMPLEEQAERLSLMQTRLKRYQVNKWASDFIEAVMKTREMKKQSRTKILNESIMKKILAEYHRNKQATLFLDYDGTLVQFKKNPDHARPDPGILKLLNQIADDPGNRLVLISGRDRNTLENWFSRHPFYLIAEHGAWLKEPDTPWTQMEPISREWKEVIRPVMEFYADRTPGSFVEEKTFSLAWHYRKSDPELGAIRAIELKDELTSMAGGHNLEILEGSKVIEIKNSGINKGRAANWFLSQHPEGFVLAIGDDWTDEYMFELLPRKSYTIKVGSNPTKARYQIVNQSEVRNLLRNFIQ